MLDRRLRPLKRDLLAPTVRHLERVPADAVTAVGALTGLAAAGSAAIGWWVPALVAWLVSRLADGLDGELARSTRTDSDRGGYLDLVADAVVYAAIPLGVAAGSDLAGAWPAAAVLIAACYVNIVTVTVLSAVLEKRRVGSVARGETTSVTLPAGLIEGFETAVLYTLMLAVPGLAVWWMVGMAAGVAVTSVIRVAGAWRVLDPAVDVDRSHRLAR